MHQFQYTPIAQHERVEQDIEARARAGKVRGACGGQDHQVERRPDGCDTDAGERGDVAIQVCEEGAARPHLARAGIAAEICSPRARCGVEMAMKRVTRSMPPRRCS